jgi:hypothetical protein
MSTYFKSIGSKTYQDNLKLKDIKFPSCGSAIVVADQDLPLDQQRCSNSNRAGLNVALKSKPLRHSFGTADASAVLLVERKTMKQIEILTFTS